MGDHCGRHGASSESSLHSDDESGGQHRDSSAREQDRLLPIANVSRIIKRALPANGKISKEAKETVQECVSEYISFITGEASDKCQREKRKTINGDDLLWAMSTLAFEEYIEALTCFLHKYREIEGEKISMVKPGDQVVAKEGSSGGSTPGMKDSSNGRGLVGIRPFLHQSYAQQHGPVVYHQHDLFAPYQFSYSKSGGATGSSGDQLPEN